MLDGHQPIEDGNVIGLTREGRSADEGSTVLRVLGAVALVLASLFEPIGSSLLHDILVYGTYEPFNIMLRMLIRSSYSVLNTSRRCSRHCLVLLSWSLQVFVWPRILIYCQFYPRLLQVSEFRIVLCTKLPDYHVRLLQHRWIERLDQLSHFSCSSLSICIVVHPEGFEPPTRRLYAACSTVELRVQS